MTVCHSESGRSTGCGSLSSGIGCPGPSFVGSGGGAGVADFAGGTVFSFAGVCFLFSLVGICLGGGVGSGGGSGFWLRADFLRVSNCILAMRRATGRWKWVDDDADRRQHQSMIMGASSDGGDVGKMKIGSMPMSRATRHDELREMAQMAKRSCRGGKPNERKWRQAGRTSLLISPNHPR